MNKITKYTTKLMVAALLLTGGLPALKADHHGAKGADTPVRGEKRIREAVESGKITKEEGRKRLEAMRKAAGANKAKGDGRGLSIEDYRRGEARIKAAVEAGKISKEDAEKRLLEMRKAVGAGKRDGGSEDRGRSKGGDKDPKGGGKEAELKRKYQAAEKEIRAAVEAGKISEEVGRKKLMEIGKELRGEGQGSSGESERKKQYQAAEKKIWAAVKAGKASKEEGEKRLAHLKEKLFGGSDKKDRDEKKDRNEKKGSDAGIEALKRELEALKRENEGLRRRLEKGKGR